MSAATGSTSEAVLDAAVKEAVAYFRVHPDRERAEVEATWMFASAIKVAALVEAQSD